MAFEPEVTRVATRLGDIGYQFLDPDPLGDGERNATVSVQVVDQNGAIIRVRQGDMIPHALPAEIQTVLALFATWRERAASEIIPAP